MKPLMGCGHAANATRADGSPVCVICLGIVAGADTVVTAPSLEGRVARCWDCSRTVPSSTDLPFFEHRPDEAEDRYYSGCRGWD
jgi:hypothetical protein